MKSRVEIQREALEELISAEIERHERAAIRAIQKEKGDYLALATLIGDGLKLALRGGELTQEDREAVQLALSFYSHASDNPSFWPLLSKEQCESIAQFLLDFLREPGGEAVET